MATGAAERAKGVGAEHGGGCQPELVEVALDRAHSVTVALDEDGARGAARERLKPHRAGARVEVENGRVLDRPDDVEDVLAHAIRRRPRFEPARRVDRVAFPRPGDDPHQGTRCV